MDDWTLQEYLKHFYFDRGFHAMPKWKGNKCTYLKYVQEDNKAHERYSWEKLEYEFEENKDIIDGIVVRTGFVKNATSIDAIDYDPRNDDDKATGGQIIEKLLEEEGLLVTESGGDPVTINGREYKGVHILCEHDPELKKVSFPGTGIEYKNNHLIVMPPSWNKNNTRQYRFRNPEGKLLKLTDKHKEILGLVNKTDSTFSSDKTALGEILEVEDLITPGNRHDSIIKVASDLQYSDLSYASKKRYYSDFVKVHCPELLRDPIRKKEVEQAFVDAGNYVRNKREGRTEEETIPAYLPWSKAVKLEIPTPPWLIEDRIPEGITTLFGNPNQGKSFVGHAIVQSLLTGKLFLGKHKPKENCKVLFVGKDNGCEADIARFRDLGIDENANLGFYTAADDFLIEDPEECERLYKVVEKERPALIVFENLRDIFTGNENDARDMNRVVQYLKKLFSLGASSLLLHHVSKNVTNPVKDLASLARGSTVLWGSSKAMYLVYKKSPTEDIIDIYPAKIKRRRPLPPFSMELLGDAEHVTGYKAAPAPQEYVHTLPKELKSDTGENTILAFLDECGSENTEKIVTLLSNQNIGRSTTYKLLKKLVNANKIRKVDAKLGGQNTKYEIVKDE